MKRAVFCLLLAPLMAQAEPQPAVLDLMPYMDTTATCLDAAPTPAQAQVCIGQGAGVCMDAEDQNQTTIGMMFCLLAEREAWDRLLNAHYASVLDGLRAMDDQDRDLFPEFANRADSLRRAQRAWIPLRDADCSLEYAMWGAGSMRQIAGADCGMRLTAQRAIYLKFLGDHMR